MIFIIDQYFAFPATLTQCPPRCLIHQLTLWDQYKSDLTISQVINLKLRLKALVCGCFAYSLFRSTFCWLRSTWAASNQCAHFRSKPWMWSQAPGTKSEGVALMYWLARSLHNNSNMHPHSSQKKCLLLSQMLLFMLQIHYQTLYQRIWLWLNILCPWSCQLQQNVCPFTASS